MASQLNIKDARTTAMVDELARLTGRSKTDIVREAVEAKLKTESEARKARSDDLMAAIREIQEKVRALGPFEPYSDDDLYDEYGLPK